MKQESNKLLNAFQKSLTKDTSAEMEWVNATLDTGFNKEIKKVFSRADLWNIHRRRRAIISRRYY